MQQDLLDHLLLSIRVLSALLPLTPVVNNLFLPLGATVLHSTPLSVPKRQVALLAVAVVLAPRGKSVRVQASMSFRVEAPTAFPPFFLLVVVVELIVLIGPFIARELPLLFVVWVSGWK